MYYGVYVTLCCFSVLGILQSTVEGTLGKVTDMFAVQNQYRPPFTQEVSSSSCAAVSNGRNDVPITTEPARAIIEKKKGSLLGRRVSLLATEVEGIYQARSNFMVPTFKNPNELVEVALDLLGDEGLQETCYDKPLLTKLDILLREFGIEEV